MRNKIVFAFSIILITVGFTACRDQKAAKPTQKIKVEKTNETKESKGILERTGEKVDNKVNKEVDKKIDNIDDDN